MKQLLPALSFFLLGFSLFAQIPDSELNALKDLYHNTQGENWNQSWDITTQVTHWKGVTIENGHVSEIRMLFNNLEGTLPASLQNLSQLKVLELSFNKINGALPSSLGNLNQLEVLALNGNNLEGTIPASLGDLKNLRKLHLSSNSLTGMLPDTINQLYNLTVFNVFQNNLSGDLPVELAKSRSIKEFIIAENNFNPSKEISTILLSHICCRLSKYGEPF